MSKLLRLIAVILALLLSDAALAANYALEITQPTAALSSNHRVKRAYTGLTYSIIVAAIGGTYPFTYSLSNAPSGMTIDAATGIITWVNPTSTATDVTVTVTDADSNTDSETWTITVGTSGFVFCDAVNGTTYANGGTGTLANPYKTLQDIWGHTATTDIAYFRTGTYDQTGLTVTYRDTFGAYVDWGTSGRTCIFLAYPGESPEIDLSVGVGTYPAAISMGQVGLVYFDGLVIKNGGNQAIRGAHGTFIRNAFNDIGPGVAESNPATLYAGTFSGDTRNVGGCILRNTFTNSTGDEVAVQTYVQNKLLIADNTFTNLSQGLAIKGNHDRFEIRSNTFTIASGSYPEAINGNWWTANDGEIRYNNINGRVWVNYSSDASNPNSSYFTRNTIVGSVFVEAETGDGPFHFINNVIVNDYKTPVAPDTIACIHFVDYTDASTIVNTDNLCGNAADSIVDANGLLTGTYRTLYLGIRGHELSGSMDSIAYGHVTGVTQPTTATFVSAWSGNGTITGSGDEEVITVTGSQYMATGVLNTGVTKVTLSQNLYRSGDTTVMKWRTCATDSTCTGAWTTYSAPFDSLGYIQLRVEAP